MKKSSLERLAPGPDCGRFAALLPLLPADELTNADAAETRAHLAACRWCQQQLKEYTALDTALRRHIASLSAAFPTLAPERVIEMVDRHETLTTLPAPGGEAPRRPRPIRRVVTWMAPLAAVLAVIVLTVAIFASRGTAHPVTGGEGATPPALYVNVAGDIVALRPGDGKLLWRSAHYGFTCQPVIDQGIAYAISGTDSVSVVALRASDGKELWLSDPMIASNPTLRAVNGVVYFSNSTYHQGQTPAFSAPAVMAFRGSDGHLLWQHPFNAPDQADNQIVSAPVVANGKVYIGAGTALFALRASDGKELWAIATNLYDLSSQEKMTVTGDSVYLYMEEPATIGPNPKPLGNTDAHLAALGANSISQRWLVNMGLTIRVLGADVIDAPVVAGGVVYVGLGSQPDASGQTQNVTLLALRASDGKQLWSYQSPPVPASDGLPLASGPFLAAGALYYSSGSGSVSAVRVSDHTPLWQHQAAASGGAVILAATDQALFVQTSNAILALRPADGATLWQQNVGE